MVRFVRLPLSPEPCGSLRSEAGYRAKPLSVRECGEQIINVTGVPGELVAPRPSAEGCPCRSRRPAAGSTPPRPRCSLAALRAERQPSPPWPEGRLDLQGGKCGQRKSVYTEVAKDIKCNVHLQINRIFNRK